MFVKYTKSHVYYFKKLLNTIFNIIFGVILNKYFILLSSIIFSVID